MKTRTSVHNDQKTLLQIKLKNEKIVDRLLNIKPVIRSDDRPVAHNHIIANANRKYLRSCK